MKNYVSNDTLVGEIVNTYPETIDVLLSAGMHCDQINLVTESADRSLSWTQTRDLHAEAWSAQGGDVSIYYQLRKSVMDGMLSESGLRLSMPNSSQYTIQLA